MGVSCVLLWLRRDLRLNEHPALNAALASGEEVVPVFCLDRRLLGGRHASGPRTQFMLESLQDLERSLKERDGGLIVLDGVPEQRLPKLAEELGAIAVHASADVSPFARDCEARMRRRLREAGIELLLHSGLFVVDDPAAVRTREGGSYTVFTPYYNAWLRDRRRPVIDAPRQLARPPEGFSCGIPKLEDLNLSQSLAQPLRGGEQVGRQLLEQFLASGVSGYRQTRNDLGLRGTSSLSPYLHFGCVSAREIEHMLGEGEGPSELRRQLCWRDFYAQVLKCFPRNARSEHQARYRGSLRWSRERGAFDAWREGRTGYPIVDAAMRQLLNEGWMHNRARLIVGSFLTKDLGIDWRWGERWFMRMLIDGDEASNNGNWQWIASVGVDPQPPARRIYNPVLQQARYDPDGGYVRRYVPELKRVPAEHLAEPWKMSHELQHETGCVIGRDYPAPIVEHAQARREALRRYGASR
jgi:deoxyribodipyrimidine photo-lyase